MIFMFTLISLMLASEVVKPKGHQSVNLLDIKEKCSRNVTKS